MISAISEEGAARFMAYEDSMTQQRLLTFMHASVDLPFIAQNIPDFGQPEGSLRENGYGLAGEAPGQN